MAEKTLFEKIIAGDLPGSIPYEDEHCAVIQDINPQAPTHLLVVPKKPIPRIGEAADDDAALLGHLLLVARDEARRQGLDNGFRLIINNGQHGGEAVPHLHIHLVGGHDLGALLP